MKDHALQLLDDLAPRQILSDLKQQLAAQPDGDAFVTQLDTALRVFSSGS